MVTWSFMADSLYGRNDAPKRLGSQVYNSPYQGGFSSGRRQNVDHAARDHVLGLGAVGCHVRRGGVGLERVHAVPLLDGEEGVRSPSGLDRQRVVGIDRGAVLDAALLGAHGG